MVSDGIQSQHHGPPALVAFWAVLGSALSWAFHIGARYPLVPLACQHDLSVVLHLVTALSVVGIAFSCWASWKLLRRGREPSVAARTRAQRWRFFGRAGLLLALLFSLAVAAELLPTFLQPPCSEGRTQLETAG